MLTSQYDITIGVGQLNLWAAWVGVLLGMMSGATLGLVFHRDDVLGEYQSWRRRLTRLGHISFFGLAAVNFAFALTVNGVGAEWGGADLNVLMVASWALIGGAVLMPLACFLAAWRKGFRHLFPLPVICLITGVTCLLYWGVTS